MNKQRAKPRDEFLAKLNAYITDYIAQARGIGAKVTRETIARHIGDYDRTTLYKWLDGRRVMPRDAVDKICALLELSDDQRVELLVLGGYAERIERTDNEAGADTQRAVNAIQQLLTTLTFARLSREVYNRA